MSYEALTLIAFICAVGNCILYAMCVWRDNKIRHLEAVIESHNDLFDQMGLDFDTGELNKRRFAAFVSTFLTMNSNTHVSDSDLHGRQR